MEAYPSETSKTFYHTTRRCISEDSYLHIHRRENLKPRIKLNNSRNPSFALSQLPHKGLLRGIELRFARVYAHMRNEEIL
jgi:hypothetical protein